MDAVVPWAEMTPDEPRAASLAVHPLLASGRMERLDQQISKYLAAGDEARLRRVTELRERLAAIEAEADEALEDVPSDEGIEPGKELLSLLSPDERRLVGLWDGEIGARLALAGSLYAPEARWVVFTQTLFSEGVEDLRGAALRGDLNFGDPRIAAKIASWPATYAPPVPAEQTVEWKVRMVLPVTEDDLRRMLNTELQKPGLQNPLMVETLTMFDPEDREDVEKFRRERGAILERVTQELAEAPMRLLEGVHWLQADFRPWFGQYKKIKENTAQTIIKETLVGTPGQVDPQTKRITLFDMPTYKMLTGIPLSGRYEGPIKFTPLSAVSPDQHATIDTFTQSPPLRYNDIPTSPKFYVRTEEDEDPFKAPRIKLEFTVLAGPESQFLQSVLPFFVRTYVTHLTEQKFLRSRPTD